MKEYKLEVTAKAKTFVNKDGETIPYIAYSADIDGNNVRMLVHPEDKKLANYLLKSKLKEV